MLVAGEASGDLLAAELVVALRAETAASDADRTLDAQPLRASLEPRFFGAGGPRMAAAGVELAFDMTAHAVIGLSAVVRNLGKFRRLFHELLTLAVSRQPDLIICVDFSGFNRRFGHAVKAYARARQGWFHGWNPKLIQFVSPQVWASREGRAGKMARDFDLLLCIFPFEKGWYARRVPQMRVEFVGHPMLDRFEAAKAEAGPPSAEPKGGVGGGGAGEAAAPLSLVPVAPRVLFLPGSRPAELARHLPLMLDVLARLRAVFPRLVATMVLPTQELLRQAGAVGLPPGLGARVGGIAEALRQADLAITKTGTTTMELAFFGVPAVALYKTSWITYQVGRRIVRTKYLSMPNILADAPVFPEFIQHAATADRVAGAALELLRDPVRRAEVKARLAEVIATLGGLGAARRAAQAVLGLLQA